MPDRRIRPPAEESFICRGRIKAEAHGARVPRDHGAAVRNRSGRGRPIWRTFCGAARTSSSSFCRAAISAAWASRWSLVGALAIWGLSGFFRVQSEELGVVLRFGKHVRTVRARPELSSALSDRDRAAAEGAARLHPLDRHDADRRSGAARPHHAGRAGRKPDADRRRKHRRRRFHRAVADQAGRRRQFPVQHPESRRHREGGGRKRDARGDRPLQDPADPDRRPQHHRSRPCRN